MSWLYGKQRPHVPMTGGSRSELTPLRTVIARTALLAAVTFLFCAIVLATDPCRNDPYAPPSVQNHTDRNDADIKRDGTSRALSPLMPAALSKCAMTSSELRFRAPGGRSPAGAPPSDTSRRIS